MEKSERHGGQNGQYANNAIENSADASTHKRQFPHRNQSDKEGNHDSMKKLKNQVHTTYHAIVSL